MKNIFFVIVSIFALVALTKNAEANIFNKFKKGFYFEKYRTAEEAKAALLKLHPIGSDVEPLIEDLERTKCYLKKIDQQKLDLMKKEYPKYQGIDEIINCKYAVGFLGWVEWRISITVKGEKIDDIGISKEYTGL